MYILKQLDMVTMQGQNLACNLFHTGRYIQLKEEAAKRSFFSSLGFQLELHLLFLVSAGP